MKFKGKSLNETSRKIFEKKQVCLAISSRFGWHLSLHHFALASFAVLNTSTMAAGRVVIGVGMKQEDRGSLVP